MIRIAILLGWICLTRLAFADSTLVPTGSVSGVWSAVHSPYIVWNGTVTVNDGDTLKIQPGVTVRFSGPYQLRVSGVLRALGRADSLIRFTADTLANPAGWGGIRFVSARDSSRLSYCIIENGRATGNWPDYTGGGVAQLGSRRITLDNVTFQDNRASQSGGAYAGNGSGGAVFTHCQFLRNVCMESGGALSLTSNSPNTFTDCDFIANTTAPGSFGGRNGGAVDTYRGNGTFTSCRFIRNYCASTGGAVQGHGFLSFSNCSFDSNRADGNAGAIYLDDSLSTFSLTHCLIRWNTAVYYGGGLYCFDSSPVVLSCQFIGNHTGDRGGAINCYRWSGTARFEDCLITQNSSNSNGGGLWVGTYCHPSFYHCEFSWNSSGAGGGAYSTNHGAPSFHGCTFLHNSAGGEGGGLSLTQYSQCALDSSTINWNSAAGTGGGFVASGSFITLSACSLSYNTAQDGAGGAMLASCSESSPLGISSSVISGNRADSTGGGMWIDGYTCASLEKVLLLDNRAAYAGGALFCSAGAQPLVTFCDLLRNQAPSGAGIFVSASSPTISTNIIAANGGRGVELWESPAAQVRFCDLYTNSGGNFAGDNLPAGLGQITQVNSNGRPCDAYSNLYLNPMLPDTTNDNYRLAAISACIDAGDSLLSCDPDMTIPDIGAVPTSQSPALLVPRSLIILPSTSEVTLQWRKPNHLCARAPIVYEIWSTTNPDSGYRLAGSTADTSYVDSTDFAFDLQQTYQVVWRRAAP
ncbi:MAG TPA: right-handed parallel beta-helix repeat-containing protein [bacterium]|jgi:hypothetical protein